VSDDRAKRLAQLRQAYESGILDRRVGQGLAGYDLVTRLFRKSVTRLGWDNINQLSRSEVVTNWLRPA
jgi:hypothetical protein